MKHLHTAMYLIPVPGLLLTLGLLIASRTVAEDMLKLQHWMRKSTASDALSRAALTEAAGSLKSKLVAPAVAGGY